jgi:hypothetical protein
MNLGTMVFAVASANATFTKARPTTCNAGDELKLSAPAEPEVGLADLAGSFMGTTGA